MKRKDQRERIKESKKEGYAFAVLLIIAAIGVLLVIAGMIMANPNLMAQFASIIDHQKNQTQTVHVTPSVTTNTTKAVTVNVVYKKQ
jgi:spore coat protein CotF